MDGACHSLEKANSQGDWRWECVTVAQMQSHTREHNLFTDVEFLIGEGAARQSFLAHKVILACGSDVFEKMFFGSMPERRHPIDIPDDDPEAFDRLLRCIYGTYVPIESFTIAWKCYVIGGKYLMPILQERAVAFVSEKKLDDISFWEIIDNNTFCSSIFKRNIDTYIESNACKILKSEQFLNVPEDIVKYILQMESLDIPEIDLLRFVTIWANNKFGNETNSKKLSLFQYIRFSTLKTKEFCNFIHCFPNALDIQSSVDILKHLINKSVCQLPNWCSSSDVLRDMRFNIDRDKFARIHGNFGHLC